MQKSQSNISIIKRFIVLIVIILLCASALYYFTTNQEPHAAPEQVVWTKANSLVEAKLGNFQDQSPGQDFQAALKSSLAYYRKQKPEREYQFANYKITAQEQLQALERIEKLYLDGGFNETFFAAIKANFKVFESVKESVLFTGYYEPELRGSLTKSDHYRYPLYRRPNDLAVITLSEFPTFASYLTPGVPSELRARITPENQIKPYFDRDQIDNQAKLKDKSLELLWVDDLIDLFFLQIQGSGRIILADGTVKRVGYAEKNGQPYRAIGKLLLDQGKLTTDNISMQAIKKYLREHPTEQAEILNYNPSYVFFRELDGPALGSIGQPVIGFRSIATDNTLFPPGSLAYISLPLPQFDEAGNQVGERDYAFFVFNQDTGGAIKSPARVDLFTGSGKQAELVAGHLAARGKLYFLAAKD